MKYHQTEIGEWPTRAIRCYARTVGVPLTGAESRDELLEICSPIWAENPPAVIAGR